jgi:hypothetical protein
MSSADVTVRLSISEPSGADMDRIRKGLEATGLRVEPDGRRGFLLSGPASRLEKLFNARIERRNSQNHFVEEPIESEILKGCDFRVYFPTKPEFF